MPSSSKRGQTRKKPGAVMTGGRRWYRRWWAVLLIFPAFLLGLAALVVFFVTFATIPLPEDIATASTVIVDAKGNEVGSLNAEVARSDIALEDLPEHVTSAVLAAEDRGFREHSGISPAGIIRAVFANARAGSIEQGGSTITQQYIKNAVVGNEQTFIRKVKEASLAVKLEREYDKDTILELYLNSIYWGRGAYGIEAAARTYFGTPAADLSLNQAATLAGIIQQPERLDPIENPEGVRTRRNFVLDGMLEEGWVEPDRHGAARAADLPRATERTVVNRGPNAYFIDAVRRTLADQMDEADLFRGLRVHTTLIQRIQAAAETALTDALADQTYTGAVVLVDPTTGAVRGLVGGPDITDQPYNTAVREYRQVGSSFKTATLAAWIEAGWSVSSVFEAPSSWDVPDGRGGTHTVSNYGGRSFDTQTVRQATTTSTNTVYVQMQEELGADKLIDVASRLGLPREREDTDGPVMEDVATLTLGVASFSPLEMAGAYATLAANGAHTTTHLVTRVEDLEGATVWEPEITTMQVMDPADAALVTDVLRGVVSSGTGGNASIGRPVAGKTGTTDDNRNAWFAGYTPDLAGAVWIGNLDNSPTDGITGGSVPARVWAAAMRVAHEGLDERAFPAADDLGRLFGALPPECDDGYERRFPPDSVDDNGWYPQVQPDSEDGEGRPCVQVSPSPQPEPSPSPTPSPTPTPSNDPLLPLPPPQKPTPSPSPTPTPTPTPAPSPSPTEP